jgi:hypothetical protein
MSKLLVRGSVILAAGNITVANGLVCAENQNFPVAVLDDGGAWSIVDGALPPGAHIEDCKYVGGQAQVVAQLPPEAEYIAALEVMFDQVARQRRYNDRYTCALRAGYPGPFQEEGKAFGSWMDACNALGYTTMAKVKAGQIACPTMAELVESMPAMVWP